MDTSVLISGISGFKAHFMPGKTNSGDLLHEWVERGSFVWLVTADISEEFKEVAKRLKARHHVAGRLNNLLKQEAEDLAAGKIIEISADPGDKRIIQLDLMAGGVVSESARSEG